MINFFNDSLRLGAIVYMNFFILFTYVSCCSNFYCLLTWKIMQVVYFVNSGSEVNELATLMAWLYSGNHDMISLRNAYHGGSAGTMGLTARSNWKYNIAQVCHTIMRIYHTFPSLVWVLFCCYLLWLFLSGEEAGKGIKQCNNKDKRKHVGLFYNGGHTP